MKKHQKHAKLMMPNIGVFGRNEVAFLGAPCSIINRIIESSALKLNSHFESVCYVDADHNHDEEQGPLLNVLQDKISFKSLNKNNINPYDQKFLLNDQNLILVNGNHFEAANQIIIIDPLKENSLKKRSTQLKNVIAIILVDHNAKTYPWLEDLIPNLENLPVFSLIDHADISNCIISAFKPVPIKALILTGGKSTRMGEDKAQIQYHGESQVDYLSKIFDELAIEYYVSVAEDKQLNDAQIIIDKFKGLGPYGAILSAFQTDPNTAWIVLACDLPLVGQKEISYLINNRNSNKTATAYYNYETSFPDPLCTIYEPKAYYQFLSFLSLGYSCPRKVLINSNSEILALSNSDFLINANTLEEKTDIINKLRK